jgi:hypothetical protein
MEDEALDRCRAYSRANIYGPFIFSAWLKHCAADR